MADVDGKVAPPDDGGNRDTGRRADLCSERGIGQPLVAGIGHDDEDRRLDADRADPDARGVPDAGEVLVDGRRVGGVVAAGVAEAVAAGVALIPQGNGLAAMLTARENVLVPLLARGVAAAHAPARADAALDAVGLGEVFSHLVEELSGGQRVAVARALALDCLVLLADEPTSELDHTNREVVLRRLRARASQGAAVVMATHDPEAAAAADRVVHLDDGVLTTP